jgi:hypothetical protein
LFTFSLEEGRKKLLTILDTIAISCGGGEILSPGFRVCEQPHMYRWRTELEKMHLKYSDCW